MPVSEPFPRSANGPRGFADNLRHLARGETAHPAVRGEPVGAIPLAGRSWSFGRGPDQDVVLDDPAVSPRHARVECRDGAYFVHDAGSDSGTFVNGRGGGARPLAEGDFVHLGPYVFRYQRGHLAWLRQRTGPTVAATGLGRRAGSVALLDDLWLGLRPGEFVGLLGGSGTGKTTLLNALGGVRPADAGGVFVDGEALYANHGRLKHLFGYVPQDDLVHPELTPRQAFAYVARLRLQPGTTAAE